MKDQIRGHISSLLEEISTYVELGKYPGSLEDSLLKYTEMLKNLEIADAANAYMEDKSYPVNKLKESSVNIRVDNGETFDGGFSHWENVFFCFSECTESEKIQQIRDFCALEGMIVEIYRELT